MRGIKYLLLASILVIGLTGQLTAQTTGKIAGQITDASTGEALVGANIVIEGTLLGAAAGMDGSYFIINIPPGIYNLNVTMMGYQATKIEGVQVSVNRTTTQDIELNQTVLETGDVVVVQADRATLKKDQTSSIRNVSSKEISILPVESVNDVVQMQAGVVGNHFRGGREGEVSYMIDGLSVNNAFAENRAAAVSVDREAIQDLEVISGTFNAEYGRAMSGMVNVITKDGGNEFHGYGTAYAGSYITPHNGDDQFVGLNADGIDLHVRDFKVGLEGPIIKDKLTFFTNFRYDKNDGYIYGIRRFNVWDATDVADGVMTSTATGDSAYVPMQHHLNLTYFGKLTYKLKNFKTMLSYSHNSSEGKSYNGGHVYKYVPDGKAGWNNYTDQTSFQINHMFARSAFYELKIGYMFRDDLYSLFGVPDDPRYVNDTYQTNDSYCGFYTGGQEKNFDITKSWKYDAKFDLTWQVNKNHSIKTGVLYTQHKFDRYDGEVRNVYIGTDRAEYDYEPELTPSETFAADTYLKEPSEQSFYLQDKMEFDEMVINMGLRYDALDPNSTYPSQRRNPGNQLNYPDEPEKNSTMIDADVKTHWSPRFGLSYLLGESAVLHFSYGHFVQMPPFERMYQRSDFRVQQTNFGTQMGNAQILPERTVSYEIGLWQELMEGMGLEVSLFYKDIYDLLTVEIYTTYNAVKYGLYGNKDYANTRGLEIKYDFTSGPLYAAVNYTLMYSRGVADSPTTTFDRAGDSQDPIPILIPVSWDQRHTFNATIGYNPGKYGMTLTAQYGSGQAYTWSPLSQTILNRVNLYPNNAYKPTSLSFDLRSHYNIGRFYGMAWKVELYAYNLFDRLNEYGVDGNTGRANQTIVREEDLAGHISDFNDYYDRLHNPNNFGAPRQIKLGLGVTF